MKILSKLILLIGCVSVTLGIFATIIWIIQKELFFAILTLSASILVGLLTIAFSKMIVVVMEIGENIGRIREEIIRINKG